MCQMAHFPSWTAWVGIRRWTLENSNFFHPGPIMLKLSVNLSHGIKNVIIEGFDSPPQASGEKTADRQNSWLFDKKFYTTFMGIKMIVMAVQFHSRRLWVMWMTSWPNYDVMSGDLFSRKCHKIDRKIRWLEYTQKAIRMTLYLIKMPLIAYFAAFIDLLIKFRPNKVESNLYLWRHILWWRHQND